LSILNIKALLSAAPIPDPKKRERTRIVLQGELPSSDCPPTGCRFKTMCWKAQDICTSQEPILSIRGSAQAVACHFPETIDPISLSI
jgi:oligopeptide/dipeptide ABC transporter ATP-binding protein